MKNLKVTLAVALVAMCCGFSQAQADDIKADNTKKNSKQYSGSNPTAQNQSNDKLAVDRTADLRKALMKKKGLSANAQNIKIIDESGKMTLRGPVDNANEKSVIEKLAKSCYGKDFVNELEIVAPSK
ncbi:MAG TPA: BON domain-containing protein [Drouetiella sp.]